MFFLFSFYTNAQDIKLNYLPKNKDSLITYINTISKNKITKFGTKYKKEIEEIIEFCDPRIQGIKEAIEEAFGVKIDSHSLYFYGTKND